MIKRQTWAVILILALLVSFSYYLTQQKQIETEKATPTEGSTLLFNEKEGQLVSIEIKPAEGDTVKVVRNNSTNSWDIELPIKAEANQSIVEAAATQLASISLVGAVEGDLEIFGLDKPTFVISIESSTKAKHEIEIGDRTPTGTGYYARLDGEKLVILGLDGIESLTNLALTPPYLNTPTPSPLPPTEAPVVPTGTPGSESLNPSATQTP